MTTATATLRFPRSTRNAVCRASDGLPTLGVWLDRIAEIGNPGLSEAIDGIWCGREGSAVLDIPGSTQTRLCVGWYNGKVEYSYLS